MKVLVIIAIMIISEIILWFIFSVVAKYYYKKMKLIPALSDRQSDIRQRISFLYVSLEKCGGD